MTPTGMYSTQVPALAGVEVRLDENRVTRTDASGYYSFHHVPFGVHRVEARLQSDEPFFYTTDSPATADMNATVDFGVNFAKGQIYGFLLNDAGTGIGGITDRIEKREIHPARDHRRQRQIRFYRPCARRLFRCHAARFLSARIRVAGAGRRKMSPWSPASPPAHNSR